jgi:hypothetical protein
MAAVSRSYRLLIATVVLAVTACSAPAPTGAPGAAGVPSATPTTAATVAATAPRTEPTAAPSPASSTIDKAVAEVTASPMPEPPTATAAPPTPTNTALPPTATPVPPTATPVPPTATLTPPTATPVPPTATATRVPPTATTVPAPPAPAAPSTSADLCVTEVQASVAYPSRGGGNQTVYATALNAAGAPIGGATGSAFVQYKTTSRTVPLPATSSAGTTAGTWSVGGPVGYVPITVTLTGGGCTARGSTGFQGR